jgi:hypothetical protein
MTTCPPIDASVKLAELPTQMLDGALTAACGIVEISMGPIEG